VIAIKVCYVISINKFSCGTIALMVFLGDIMVLIEKIYFIYA